MDVVDLVRYGHHLWRAFAAAYAELPPEELVRDHGASHGSVANVTVHAVNMEDWYLHYVLPGKAWDGPAWDSFRDAKAVEARVREVEARTERFLAGLRPVDLAARHALDLGAGTVEVSLGELLAEVVNETSHHRGEVMAMLWRMDREPPYESYLDWAARRKA